MKSREDGITILVSEVTAWAALCDFTGRSKWVALNYKQQLISEEPMQYGTHIRCDVGYGECLLSVQEFDPPHRLVIVGTIGTARLRVSYKVMDILDGAYVGVCLELDNDLEEEGSQLAVFREWAIDQLNSIKRQAELGPRMR